MTFPLGETTIGGGTMDAPPLGWTAEGRARKMRALRAEAGRKAKEELDAARERCAPCLATAFTVEPHSHPRRHPRH